MVIEVDSKAEMAKLSQDMETLAIQLKQLDQQRQDIANAIVKCQGAIEYLQRLGGGKE